MKITALFQFFEFGTNLKIRTHPLFKIVYIILGRGEGSRNFWTFSTFLDIRYSLSESGVPPNSVLFGGTVPPNSVLFGGTVPPNSVLFGGTVPPNSFPLCV